MVQPDDELDIARRFEALMLAEPPMTSTVSDDVRRGRRALRQQRVMVVGASAAAVVGVTAGVVALSASGPFGSAAQQASFAGAPSGHPVATPSAPESVAASETEQATPNETVGTGTTTTPDDPLDGQNGDGFPAYDTRVLLRAAANEHLDPAGGHLIGGYNAQSQEDAEGLVGAGTKLGWVVPGDDGQGLVQVGIEVAHADTSAAPGWRPRMETQCDVVACQAHSVAGGGTVFVNDGEDPAGTGLEIGAYYQQPDGEWVFVTVYDTFGNMSPEGVESVGVTVEQVIAFVTDPSLEMVG